MSYEFGKRSLKNLIGVHPELGFAAMEAIKISKQDFGVFEGVRTMQRQKELVWTGTSHTLDGYHLYGLAVDLVAWTGKKYSWNGKYYQAIHKSMMEVIKAHGLHIQNGFDMWGWDHPHWQMTGYKKLYDIRKIRGFKK
jgi:peptidoglycan L-alanyl-D-glutamate endopeptidase CwlK